MIDTPLTSTEARELLRMTRAIYHHLGLDGARVISMRESREKVDNDVLKWREKRGMKGHEREADI